MFTGLIEAVGKVAEVESIQAGFRMRVVTDLAGELGPGDSIAVNGVCLTVVLGDAKEFHAEISPETARVTTLGTFRPGSIVNLERPLRAEARLGGHFVLGHIDDVGHVDEIREDAEFFWVTIRYPPALSPYIVQKGSIAVDGISLTVADLGERCFGVQLVPHTWRYTHLHTLALDDPVNLECDIIGKHVVKALEVARDSGGGGVVAQITRSARWLKRPLDGRW